MEMPFKSPPKELLLVVSPDKHAVINRKIVFEDELNVSNYGAEKSVNFKYSRRYKSDCMYKKSK